MGDTRGSWQKYALNTLHADLFAAVAIPNITFYWHGHIGPTYMRKAVNGEFLYGLGLDESSLQVYDEGNVSEALHSRTLPGFEEEPGDQDPRYISNRVRELLIEWWGWRKCRQMIEEAERARGAKYTIIARARIDYVAMSDVLSRTSLESLLGAPDEIRDNLVLVPEGFHTGLASHNNQYYEGVDDHIAIGGRTAMFTMMNILTVADSPSGFLHGLLQHPPTAQKYTKQSLYHMYLRSKGIVVHEFKTMGCVMKTLPDWNGWNMARPTCKYTTELVQSAVAFVGKICQISPNSVDDTSNCRIDLKEDHLTLRLLKMFDCTFSVDDKLWQDSRTVLLEMWNWFRYAMSLMECEIYPCEFEREGLMKFVAQIQKFKIQYESKWQGSTPHTSVTPVAFSKWPQKSMGDWIPRESKKLFEGELTRNGHRGCYRGYGAFAGHLPDTVKLIE